MNEDDLEQIELRAARAALVDEKRVRAVLANRFGEASAEAVMASQADVHQLCQEIRRLWRELDRLEAELEKSKRRTRPVLSAVSDAPAKTSFKCTRCNGREFVDAAAAAAHTDAKHGGDRTVLVFVETDA